MVELLMAMFIFAIGLLGLMALQVVTTTQGGGSRVRGTATFIAHTTLDRIVGEGLASSLERFTPPHVITTDTNRVFLNSTASAGSGTSTADLFFDINGNPLPASMNVITKDPKYHQAVLDFLMQDKYFRS